MPDSKSSSSSGPDDSDEEIYEVERIVSKKIVYGLVQYYIKWKNYPSGHNSWEPVENLSCEQLIEEYEAKHTRRVDSIEWDPKPKTITGSFVANGKTEYYVTFEDGESESVTLTFGPMKKLIENWKKESKKEDKEKGKGKKNDDGKETKGSAKKERKTIKRKVKADENGNQNDDKSYLTNSLIYSQEIERICDMRRTNDGIEYLVAYKDSEKAEWIPMPIVKRNHPQKVIHFYESCIVWE